MKQFLESLLSLRAKINNSLGDFLNYKPNNSFNKTEYHLHMHGPVNFINRSLKTPKHKIKSQVHQLEKISKF